MRLVSVCLTLIMSSGAFFAHAQQPSSSPPAVPVLTLKDNANLVRIDSGIFEIQVGRTIDITDEKLIFMITSVQGFDDPANIRVNFIFGGRQDHINMGKRVNLKSMSDDLKKFKRCNIDLVKAEEVRGAPASATFRLDCQ